MVLTLELSGVLDEVFHSNLLFCEAESVLNFTLGSWRTSIFSLNLSHHFWSRAIDLDLYNLYLTYIFISMCYVVTSGWHDIINILFFNYV